MSLSFAELMDIAKKNQRVKDEKLASYLENKKLANLEKRGKQLANDVIRKVANTSLFSYPKGIVKSRNSTIVRDKGSKPPKTKILTHAELLERAKTQEPKQHGLFNAIFLPKEEAPADSSRSDKSGKNYTREILLRATSCKPIVDQSIRKTKSSLPTLQTPKNLEISHNTNVKTNMSDECQRGEKYYAKNYSSIIRQMFDYSPQKYHGLDDDDCMTMESNYNDIQREEKRSAKIGKLEDEIEEQKEKEYYLCKKASR